MAIVTGTSGNDILIGTAEADSISGLGGADTLFGLGGNDTLDGGAGWDLLIGGADADALDGGSGIDTASYAGSLAGVTIKLWNGTGTGGNAEGDSLTSIENLIGSDFDDTFSGDNTDNYLARWQRQRPALWKWRQ